MDEYMPNSFGPKDQTVIDNLTDLNVKKKSYVQYIKDIFEEKGYDENIRDRTAIPCLYKENKIKNFKANDRECEKNLVDTSKKDEENELTEMVINVFEVHKCNVTVNRYVLLDKKINIQKLRKMWKEERSLDWTGTTTSLSSSLCCFNYAE